MPIPDYYAILQVSPNAKLEQIRQAYRRLARLHHPDLNKTVEDLHIKELNEAYNILSNAARRNAYDIQRLEDLRRGIILDALKRQQEKIKREPRMTWKQGMVGFVTEFKKGLREE